METDQEIVSSVAPSGTASRPGTSLNFIALVFTFPLIVAVAFSLFWVNRERPYGIPARIPWTASHVSGTPDAPSPYEAVRVFPKLTFDHPLDIAFAPGSTRIFIAQQNGKLYSFPNDPNVDHADVFFDPASVQNLDKVPDCKGTSDTLALTFHPQFQKNRYCYVQYNLDYTTYLANHENGSRVSRFTVTESDPPKIDPKSEVVFLEWLSGGHNGCALKFGPDGYLYISTGDSGTPNPPDPRNSGQDISDLLCSVLRIDVDHPGAKTQYAIPADNPFVATPGARPEVYAYGLRNPFRMNFDSKTGNLWLGDVGWELWESVFCIKSGGNYGWSIMEGPNPVHPDGKRGPTEIVKPLAAISHSEAASLTGGLVYRGTKLPELYGYYIFGDWQTSRLWAAKCIGEKEDSLEPYKEIAQTDQRIVAFGEDPEHEPIILDHGGGGLYRLVRNTAVGQPSTFPRKLSETGLFSSLKEQTPSAGVVPFKVNAAQWVDGAIAERWIATPDASTVTWGKGVWGDDRVAWPKDSVLVRTFSLESREGKKPVETQLLQFDGRQWRGYTYAWSDDQTEAELIGSGGDDRVFTVADSSASGGKRQQTWHYASRAQCMTCHNQWGDYTLAFNIPELDRVERYLNEKGDAIEDNQIRTFKHIGFILDTPPPARPKPPPDPNAPPPPPARPAPPKPAPEKYVLTDPYDSTADLNERARSYLHINCAHCHRFGGGGAALFDVSKEKHPGELNAINAHPVLGDFGIDGANLICAGDPSRSVILYRTSKLGRSRMPHIGSEVVDEKGTAMLRQWIASLSAPPEDDAVAKTRADQQQALSLVQNPGASKESCGATVDRLLASTSGALALLGEVQSGKLPEPVRQIAIAKGIASPQEAVHDLFRRFDPREGLTARLGARFDREKLVATKGDAARGRKIFHEVSSGLCARCHRVNGQGTDFGPDLSHIATKYDKAQLLENIVEPSKTIADGFTSYNLKTSDGKVLTGLLVSKTGTEVVFKDTQKQYRIPAVEVQKMQPLTISAMPEGLLADLSPQDAADLLEYLHSLK